MAQTWPRPFLSSSRGAPFFNFGVLLGPALKAVWHNGTQRKHKGSSSDMPSIADLLWHQMWNFFGKLWLCLWLGRPWVCALGWLLAWGFAQCFSSSHGPVQCPLPPNLAQDSGISQPSVVCQTYGLQPDGFQENARNHENAENDKDSWEPPQILRGLSHLSAG